MRPQFPSSTKTTMLLSSCNLPSTQPNITRCILNGYFDDQSKSDVFTFGGAKRSGSDRVCKYFPIGMNAREPLWR